MAQASISLDHEQFICPICLDVLKDPAAVPCGHSYCMSCIEGCWDKNDPTRSYSCPQCRQTFTSRPFLGKNTALAEVVEKLKKTGLISAHAADCYAGPGDVPCDFCIVEKRRASKTCLMCLASYCEAHLQPHFQVPALKKHKLVKAIAQLQDKICPRHDKLMEVYCRTDQTCICCECSMDEHKDHDTVSAATECMEKQKQLGDTQNEHRERIRHKEWDLQALKETVETLRVSVHVAMEDSDRILTDFTHSIEKRRSAVKELIREQGKATQNHAEEMQERLGLEIAELREKVTELEQLSKTEDHIHFLQRFQSLCAPLNALETPSTSAVPVSDFWPIKKVLSELKQSLDSVSNDEWLKSSKADNVFAGPKTRQEFLQYSCKLTLDFNTAHNHIRVCEDDPDWILMGFGEKYPDHPERFEHVQQVLCSEGLTGRCYWETGWAGTHVMYIAVAYKGIDRKGEGNVSHFVHSDKSWCLKLTMNTYSVWHNSEGFAVYPTQNESHRIGVYLDHSAGTLSFFCVSNTAMTLLHRFQTTFTEPLYPGLGGWVSGDRMRILTLERTVKGKKKRSRKKGRQIQEK